MADGAKDWSERLMGVVRGDTKSGLIQKEASDLEPIVKEATDLEPVVTWAASHLANLVMIPSMTGNEEWQLNILHFLLTYGYFTVNHKITVHNKVCDVLFHYLQMNLAIVGNQCIQESLPMYLNKMKRCFTTISLF